MKKRIIALVLMLAMLLQVTPVALRASAVETVLYVKDVQLIYAKDVQAAKDQLPAGYLLYEENLNRGADVGVYLCYTTTQDPDLAITDMRVMHENGGFDRGTFNDKMDQALEMLNRQAEGIYNAIQKEFRPNYLAKLPGAVYAHDQLNVFMFDEKTPLGEYLLSDKLTVQDISQMLLVCHNTILTAVLSLVAQGLQRKEGEDWLDKLETMDPADYENNAELQQAYAPLINQIQPALNAFSDQYNIMVYTDDVRDSMTAQHIEMYAEDLNDEDAVQWWYGLWDILNSHPLAGDSGMTAESVLVEWYLGESVANHKVCMLIDAMTEGQRALVGLIGPLNLIFNDLFTEEDRLAAEAELAQIKDQKGKISLWDGVDMDIFTSEVGITGVAYDEMITSNNYDIFTEENVVLEMSAQDYISLITYCSSLVSGAISTFNAVALLAKGYAGSSMICKGLAHVGAFLAKGLLGTIFTYAPMVVAGLCLLATLILWIVNSIQADKPPEHDRTTIPKYMVDSITDDTGAQRYEIYKRVDNVKTDTELKKADLGIGDVRNLSGADLNGCKGYHWAALYVSRNPAAGNPVEADFLISDSFSAAPEGYLPLRHFNKKTETVNLNAVDSYAGNDAPLYLFYRGQGLTENHRVYRYVRNLSVVTVSLRYPQNPDEYRFSAAEAEAIAKKELTETGYFVVDYNFSTDPDAVTYMGWNGTDREENAIKDIRLVYKSSIGRAGSGYFGTMVYGNLGNINGWSLFVSRGSQNPAPPVTTLKLIQRNADPADTAGYDLSINQKESTLSTTDGEKTVGWEPVNEFTGGDAVPMGNLGAQLYFLPETVFTEGPDYLAGVKSDNYITNLSYKKDSHNCDHSDIWDNDFANYKAYKETTLGEHFFENSFVTVQQNFILSGSVQSIHDGSENNPDCSYFDENGYHSKLRLTPKAYNSYKYTLTKNPYRAIYAVAANTSPDSQMRSSVISYDALGYALAPAEITISMANIEIPAFSHREVLESGREFQDKTLILEDKPYHSNGILVNLDITQTNFGEEYLERNNLYVAGYSPDRTPLTVEDFVFSTKLLAEGDYPDNFIPIPYMGGDGTDYTMLAPLPNNIVVNQWGNSAKHFAGIYQPVYAYVRSEVKTDDVTTTYMPGTGKYISELFLASKEKLRVAMLEDNKDATCEDITLCQLETQLISAGATTTFKTGVGTDYYSDGNDNANTVLLGYTRTDDPAAAIRDIRFYVCQKKERPPEKIDAKITANGKEQTVTYYLVDEVSLTSKANLDCKKQLNNKGVEVWQETELLSERQAYVYVTYNQTAFPKPITDIQISTWCTPGAYTPLLSFANESIYTVKQQSDVNLHVKNQWFESGKTFSFLREGTADAYVSEIAVKNGGDRTQVMASLLEAGYSVLAQDMNENAAGDHIFLGVKYTDDEDKALRQVATYHKKNPANTYQKDGVTYRLCAKVDLNKGAGGDYIYLYATTDAAAGTPIVNLYGANSTKNNSDALYSHTTVKRLDNGDYANLNDGTTFFTADIYLIAQRNSTAGKYISEVCVVYAWSRSGAIEKLRKKGFAEFIDKDLNDGTGSSQYIYLGYKRTDDPKLAIRDLMLFLNPSEVTKERAHGKIAYTLASDVNLNRHCNAIAADIYLYYTKDAAAGEPLTALYCSDRVVEPKKDAQGYHRTAKGVGYGTYDDGYADLNRWALGDYIYLVMVSAPEAGLVASVFGNGSWTVILMIVVGLTAAMATTGIVCRKKGKGMTKETEKTVEKEKQI